MTTLLIAFADANYADTLPIAELNENEQELFCQAKDACYKWNRKTHDALIAKIPFQRLLRLPFLDKENLMSGFSHKLLYCRNMQYGFIYRETI